VTVGIRHTGNSKFSNRSNYLYKYKEKTKASKIRH